jgi:hypothetical protein
MLITKLILIIYLSCVKSNIISNFYKYSTIKKINICEKLSSIKNNNVKNKINDIISNLTKNFEYRKLSEKERYYLLTIVNIL